MHVCVCVWFTQCRESWALNLACWKSSLDCLSQSPASDKGMVSLTREAIKKHTCIHINTKVCHITLVRCLSHIKCP